AVRNIARLVSGAWTAVGTGVASNTGAESVRAFANFNSQLVVGGFFDTANGVTSNSIAQWNGTVWSTLGTGMLLGGSKGTVDTLVVFNNALIAGGLFNSAGGVGVNSIASWDGATWSNMSAGILTPVEEVVKLVVYDNQLL